MNGNPITPELAEGLKDLGFVRESSLASAIWKANLGDRDWKLTLSTQSRTKYHGEVRTRQRLGFRFRIEVTTVVKTRLFWVRSGIANSTLIGWIYRLRRHEVVRQLSDTLPGHEFVAHDHSWARALARRPQAMAAAARLSVLPKNGTVGSSVYFCPQTLNFGSGILQPDDIHTDQISQWINDLNTLASEAESIPKPGKESETSTLERLAKQNPLLSAMAILAILACVVGVIGLMVSSLLIAIAYAL